MDTQIVFSATSQNFVDDFADQVTEIAANTAADAQQQTPLSDADLMPFYFLSMAGGY